MERILSFGSSRKAATTCVSSTHNEWRLARGCVLSFTPSRAPKLQCVAGKIWITQGDARDIILRAGEEIELRRGAKIVAQSLTEAAILRQT
jgi:hypothetical protein